MTRTPVALETGFLARRKTRFLNDWLSSKITEGSSSAMIWPQIVAFSRTCPLLSRLSCVFGGDEGVTMDN